MQVGKGRSTCVRERRASRAAQSWTHDAISTDAASIAASSRCMMARSALAGQTAQISLNAFLTCKWLADPREMLAKAMMAATAA